MQGFIFLFLIISSGSVLCGSVFNKKYEEILPITCSTTVLILFCFGLVNLLEVGAIVLCILGFCCYIFALIWAIKHNNFKQWFGNLFTMSSIIFTLLCFFSAYSIHGKLLHSWDEFTHWGVVVKDMVRLNDLGTNPIADLTFPAYPPGISLFQYFLEKIHIWITGETFCEWLLYVAFQTVAYAFLVPCIGARMKKNIVYGLVSAVILVLVPTIFYEEIYCTLYVDPLIGILAGVGMATILWQKKDIITTLQIFAICSMLVLVKDAGMLFAVILSVIYVVMVWGETKKINMHFLMHSLIVLGATCLPKILWKIDVSINNARIAFSNPIDIKQLINILLRRDTTYKMKVWNIFWEHLFMDPLEFGHTGIITNYFSLGLILLLLLAVLIRYGIKKEILDRISGKIVWFTVIIQAIIYIVGLVVAYIFKFSDYEALRLASYNRYMNILYLAISIVVIISLIKYLSYIDGKRRNIKCIGVLVLIMFISPVLSVYNHFINHESVYISMEVRKPYENMVRIMENKTKADDSIYLIAQESDKFEYWILRYELRTRKMNNSEYSLGKPFYEGDIYSVEKSPKEWQQELVDAYDYVALYQINDYFIENYGVLFGEAEVVSKSLYKVDKKNQTLELIE